MSLSETQNKLFLKNSLKGFRYYKKSGFKLASGEMSPYFFDIKMAIGNSQILYDICCALQAKLESYYKIKSIGGIEMGSVPIASAFALYNSILCNSTPNFFYVRKEKKDHGTEKMIEGIIQPNAVLIEDVMTTGKTVGNALRILSDNGQKINVVTPIIFRGTPQDICDLEKKLHVKIEPVFYEAEFND